MKTLLIGSLFILLGIGAKAQAALGFANTSTPGLSDTVLMGSIVTYGVNVQNTGTQPFSGDFTVFIAIYDSSLFLQNPFDSVVVTTNSLMAGDTSGVTITHDISPAKFMDGNNTVVIWPAAPGYQTTDSIIRNIFVITFQDSDEFTVNQLNIYPNPASDYLIIQGKYEVENVRILDMNGRILLTTRKTILDLSPFPDGTYLLELETKEEKFLRKKIILQK